MKTLFCILLAFCACDCFAKGNYDCVPQRQDLRKELDKIQDFSYKVGLIETLKSLIIIINAPQVPLQLLPEEPNDRTT